MNEISEVRDKFKAVTLSKAHEELRNIVSDSEVHKY